MSLWQVRNGRLVNITLYNIRKYVNYLHLNKHCEIYLKHYKRENISGNIWIIQTEIFIVNEKKDVRGFCVFGSIICFYKIMQLFRLINIRSLWLITMQSYAIIFTNYYAIRYNSFDQLQQSCIIILKNYCAVKFKHMQYIWSITIIILINSYAIRYNPAIRYNSAIRCNPAIRYNSIDQLQKSFVSWLQ